jgi:hypothetical protein
MAGRRLVCRFRDVLERQREDYLRQKLVQSYTLLSGEGAQPC